MNPPTATFRNGVTKVSRLAKRLEDDARSAIERSYMGQPNELPADADQMLATMESKADRLRQRIAEVRAELNGGNG